jgi:hypothetical protein
VNRFNIVRVTQYLAGAYDFGINEEDEQDRTEQETIPTIII